MAVTMYYLYSQGKIDVNPDEIGTSVNHGWLYLLPGILLTALFIGLNYYYREKD